eukprot:COSAG02_NODE_3627_length_6451_cov_5.110202_1_plen_277_part_00
MFQARLIAVAAAAAAASRMHSVAREPEICDSVVLRCFARSVPSLSGRPVEFIAAACRSAYAQHEAELDSRSFATSATARHSWFVVQDRCTDVEVAADTRRWSAHRPDELPETMTLTWTDSDADDDADDADADDVTDRAARSSCSNGPDCLIVYDTGSTGALLQRHLTHPSFRVAESFPGSLPAVLWARTTRYTASNATQWRHSFRGEEWLTEKDWLARLVQLTAGRASWSQESFTICDQSAETGSMRSQVRPVHSCNSQLTTTSTSSLCSLRAAAS